MISRCFVSMMCGRSVFWRKARDGEAATEMNNMEIMVIKCNRKLQEVVGGKNST